MNKHVARMWIRAYTACDMPVHPERARQLYRDAEWELPPHLIPPSPLCPEVQNLLNILERAIFNGHQETLDTVEFTGLAEVMNNHSSEGGNKSG